MEPPISQPWSFRRWFTGNAVALVVVVLAGFALVGVLLGLPLLENARYQAPPTEVAKGEPVEAAGYTWTLLASDEFPHSPENEAVPEGLAVTAAIIRVEPGDNPNTSGSCTPELMVGHEPGARLWTTLGNPWAFNYEVLDESTTTCLFEGEPFDLEVVYLTPEGTISDAVVEVEIGVLGGELLRFALTD
jgi:hypothetical protein